MELVFKMVSFPRRTAIENKTKPGMGEGKELGPRSDISMQCPCQKQAKEEAGVSAIHVGGQVSGLGVLQQSWG